MTRSALRQVTSPMILIPAHGQRYDTREHMQMAWDAGKDFKIYGSSMYCSKRDLTMLQDDSSSITITDPRSMVSLVVG